MNRILKITICLLLCVNLLSLTVFGRELVAVGQVVGLELQDGTVTVASFDTQLGSAAQAAGLQVGDKILSIDGKTIRSAADVTAALQSSKGTVTVQICRDDVVLNCKIDPQITPDGPKLGLYLRQGVTGVGTVTWYDPEDGSFGALGHGVNNSAGQLLEMKRGTVYESRIAAIRKGKVGEPGQLMGCVESCAPIGTLNSNTSLGVFGTSRVGWEGRSVETAAWGEIRTGKATILSTVSGSGVQEYAVEILKIYPQAKQTGRNFLIKVTDPTLLAATGGIVQGMSGSPIIQNGKLIGAVTHVLVNDPTTGYGVFIDNMLDAAG